METNVTNITDTPKDVLSLIYSHLNEEDPLLTIQNRENFAKTAPLFQSAADNALDHGRVRDHRPLMGEAEDLNNDKKKLNCLNKKAICYYCAFEISVCSGLAGVVLVCSSCGCCCCTVSSLATKIICITGGSLGAAGALGGIITWAIGGKFRSIDIDQSEASSLVREVGSRIERLNEGINGRNPEVISMSDE